MAFLNEIKTLLSFIETPALPNALAGDIDCANASLVY